jgi:hypothetical protein
MASVSAILGNLNNTTEIAVCTVASKKNVSCCENLDRRSEVLVAKSKCSVLTASA